VVGSAVVVMALPLGGRGPCGPAANVPCDAYGAPVRRIWPEVAEVDDVAALVAAEARPAPPGRPWLAVNMVASVDGATAVGGVSGPLGGAGDKAVFSALRAVADVILAGAGTVRAEGYGPPRTPPARRAERRARGQTEVPRIAVVTRSMELDLASPLFTEAEVAPIVLTCATSDHGLRAAVAEVAEVVVAGDDAVDLPGALAALGDLGASVVLAEGGPHLNGELVAAGLVDEWCTTVAPLLAAGGSDRPALGPGAPAPQRMRLDRLLEHDGELLARYVRDLR
jgi:riboflavin biosynthesis pyrimidine reductase